jgi:predicted transcriptional regulator
MKLWQSEIWMRRKYLREKLSEHEIAELAGCSQPTVNRYLRKFNLKK